MAKLLSGTRIYGTANVDNQIYVGADVSINATTFGVGTINATANGAVLNSSLLQVGNTSVYSNVGPGVVFATANITSPLFTGNVTGTSSNATNLNSQPGSYYTNATNITVGTLADARLSANYSTGTALTANNTTYVNSKTEGNLNVNNAVTANSSTYLGANLPAYYTNATNITTGTLPWAQAPTNTVNTSAAFTFSGVHTYNANLQVNASFSVTNSTATVLSAAANGNVGIGTASPDATFAVTGTANISGAVTLSNTLNVTGLATTGNLNTTTANVTTLSATTSITGAANLALTGVLHTLSGNVNIDSGLLFVDGTNNRVGVNNTSPDATFAVTGTANISGVVTLSNTLTVKAISANGGVGTAGQALSSNGSAVYWATVAQATANLTLYTSGSGTWTKPASGTFARVRMWGGGGSGAHGGAGSQRQGGGGGGGGYAERYYILSDLAATESYAVGAGGVAITANTSGGVTGNPGGTSTFSTSTNALNAYGGGGGGRSAGGANGGGAGTLFAAGGTATSITPSSATQPFGAGDGGFGDTSGGLPIVPGKGYMGGGGGGAVTNPLAAQAGGTSVGGGAGGAANLTATATSGSAPGGGGGATGNSISTAISSGAGGAGRIEVWVW
jgi:hypothetical protein